MGFCGVVAASAYSCCSVMRDANASQLRRQIWFSGTTICLVVVNFMHMLISASMPRSLQFYLCTSAVFWSLACLGNIRALYAHLSAILQESKDGGKAGGVGRTGTEK